MKQLIILVPDGDSNLSSIVGSYKIFKRANQFMLNSGGEAVFHIQIAGTRRKVNFHDDLFSVNTVDVHQIKKADLVIIPSLNHKFHDLSKYDDLADWLVRQYKKGAEIASICTGGFLLAYSGLLDGKICSTHWSAADHFKKMFPSVELVADKIITHEKGLYTNGGAFSFLNLIVYLVERYYGRKTALYCAKVFQIDIDRNSQSPFMMFTGLKDHADQEIQRAQMFMEKSLAEKINIEKVATRFAVSRRNFDRRFVKATGHTPIEYLQKLKIEAAKKLLESTKKSVSQVMGEVGYYDSSAFRNLFKKITGLTPLEYRKKFSQYVSTSLR